MGHGSKEEPYTGGRIYIDIWVFMSIFVSIEFHSAPFLAPVEGSSLEPCPTFYGRINRSSTEGLTDTGGQTRVLNP